MKNKCDVQNRSPKTVSAYRNVLKRFLPENFWSKSLIKISEEDIEHIFKQRAEELHPTQDALKKALQYIRAIFRFAVMKRWCLKDPTTTVDLENFNSLCKIEKKQAEEKEVSPEEVSSLRTYALQHTDNPRALIMLLASQTGMRCAELCALRWEDVESDYLHIHRQQLITENGVGKRSVCEVQYTKDERQNPHDGRRFPRTAEINHVLELAKALPGNSVYVFHDGDSWVLKDGYVHYLRKCCQRLGTQATNNHAFRMALNGELIDKGFNSVERSLLLGHSVETNERHYSLADRRRPADICSRMVK